MLEAFNLIGMISCLDKETQTLLYSKCFSLSYHSDSSAPALLQPSRLPGLSLSLSLSKYFRQQASSMVRCFGCLFRWAAADDMIVRSALPSTDHPAGCCRNNGQQARQETGNRMKKGRTSCSSRSLC